MFQAMVRVWQTEIKESFYIESVLTEWGGGVMCCLLDTYTGNRIYRELMMNVT